MYVCMYVCMYIYIYIYIQIRIQQVHSPNPGRRPSWTPLLQRASPSRWPESSKLHSSECFPICDLSTSTFYILKKMCRGLCVGLGSKYSALSEVACLTTFAAIRCILSRLHIRTGSPVWGAVEYVSMLGEQGGGNLKMWRRGRLRELEASALGATRISRNHCLFTRA